MPENEEFRSLIRRVRDRDEEAARELATKYESAIRRVVRIHLRDARMRRVLDSMDICQSVLASFFVRTALGQYDLDSPDQLIRLLTVITRNKLNNQIERMKSQRRDLRRDIAIEQEGFDLFDKASDPGEQVAAREILSKVYSKLDPTEKQLAEQRSLGRTWQELADEMGGTDVALRKKLARALDRVLNELGLDGPFDE